MNLAISGKMRSGKDTVAEYLEKKYKYSTNSFATSLKNSAGFTFNISSRDLFVDKPENVRKCLQLFGQAGRAYNPDIWVDNCFEYMNKFDLRDGKIIITDLRFKNEAKRLKEKGFKLIRISRDRDKRVEFGLSNEDDISETDLDDYTEFDYWINNNGTKEELFELIDTMFKEEIK